MIPGCDPTNGVHEYITVYVDALLIATTEPSSIIKSLQEQHQFKFKGTGPLQYHPSCDYFFDEHYLLAQENTLKR
jgi:hypothetical protein